jgi:glycosyltransferase involved in cell wall biosynthesis
MPIIETLLSAGWKVVIATTGDQHTDRLKSSGCIHESVPFKRGGFSISKDGQAYLKLRQILRAHEPELVHLFHAKPVILGGMASGSNPDSKLVCTITGLGSTFQHSRAVRFASSFGYCNALKHCQLVIFQNPDDRQLFLDRQWIDAQKTRLIIGAGVDLDRFYPGQRSVKNSGEIRILMVSRLLWSKGVPEFIDAAEQVAADHPGTRFQLAGEWDPDNPEAVDPSFVEEARNRGAVEFLGYLDDMPGTLRRTDIFVLPTYYGEGVPRVILEASASAVPVVSTDVPGCREAVIDGETGLLVPARDNQALSSAIAKLLEDEQLRQKLGRNGRRMVEERFDIHAITHQYLEVYREAGIEIE